MKEPGMTHVEYRARLAGHGDRDGDFESVARLMLMDLRERLMLAFCQGVAVTEARDRVGDVLLYAHKLTNRYLTHLDSLVPED